MKKTTLLLIWLFAVTAVFAEEGKGAVVPPTEQKVTPAGRKLKFVAWDAHMLGIDTPEKAAAIKKNVRRTPVIGLVSFSGIDTKVLKKNIEYAYGPAKPRGMHDTYQISEVLQIAKRVGVPIKIRVYPTTGPAQVAEALRLAGKETDIVITYSSYWSDTKPMLEAVAANPETLYISPYVQVGKRPTGKSFQSGARHPDGGGLENFVTALPLCRHKPFGALLTPLHRDKNDSETVNFISPSSYAHNRGETCPAAGVTLVVAAYVAAASPEKVPAKRIVEVMLRNTSIPEERMLELSDFDARAVQNLRRSLGKLTGRDDVGIRRLEAEGVLDLWKIHEELTGTSPAAR